MSRYYRLRCTTCHGFDRSSPGDCGNINHGALYLKAIIPCLPAIATLDRCEAISVRLEYGDGGDITGFAVRHWQHMNNVRVIDEYGAFYDECSERIRCVCGHDELCALPDKHEGEHKPRRLLTPP